MSPFILNKVHLDSETISEQLRRVREEKSLKLQKVAEKLNLNQAYLEALERHEFWKLPKGVYGKKILQEYAIFLGLNYREMTEVFDKEAGTETKEKEKELFSAQVAKTSYFRAMPKIFRNLAVALTIIVCFFYLGYRLDKIVAPPFLIVDFPTDNLITDEKTINVSGSAEAETQIIVNGEQVLLDTQGKFSKKVDLKTGINVITVTAKKKYGRTNIIQRQILVKDANLEL